MHAISAAAATLVAVAFSLSALDRYRDTRRRHQLMWTIALAMFAAGSLSLFVGDSVGWGTWTYKSFYLFGAILNVPFLALGTVYLLGGIRRGDRAAAVVSLLGAFAAGMVVMAPMVGEIDPEVLPQGSDVFGAGPRIAAAMASGIAATVIIVGALWSVASLLRSPRPPGAGRLAAANVCIALGTLVLSASGLLNSVFDEMEAFAVTLVVGITIIFVGFLITNRRSVAPPVAWRPAPEISAGLGEGPSRSSLVGARPRT